MTTPEDDIRDATAFLVARGYVVLRQAEAEDQASDFARLEGERDELLAELKSEREVHARTQRWLDTFQSSTAQGTVGNMLRDEAIRQAAALLADRSNPAENDAVSRWLALPVVKAATEPSLVHLTGPGDHSPEGGPDIYDSRTRTVLAHPAQKLAVQAFEAEKKGES